MESLTIRKHVLKFADLKNGLQFIANVEALSEVVRVIRPEPGFNYPCLITLPVLMTPQRLNVVVRY